MRAVGKHGIIFLKSLHRGELWHPAVKFQKRSPRPRKRA